jgi:hypothetical protein
MKKKIRIRGRNNFSSLLWTGQNQERKRPNSWELLVAIGKSPTLYYVEIAKIITLFPYLTRKKRG